MDSLTTAFGDVVRNP
jgi:RNase adaptor protein for sRNA GlmZ degradation